MVDKAWEIINQEIEKLGLGEPISKWKSILCLMVGIFVGGALLLGGFLLYDGNSMNGGSITMIAFGVISILIGILLWVHFQKIYNRVVRENIKKILVVWEKWHHLYFENTSNFFSDKYKLTFQGFTKSKTFNGTLALAFVLNDEEISFSLSEDVETRTRTVRRNNQTITETYYVYFLKYNLRSQASMLKGYDEINMSQGRLKRPRDGFLSSESIAFNNKYIVKGNNQLQVYKLFTPRVIDTYVNYDNFGADSVTLVDGMAYVNFRSTIERESSYCPEINNLALINWKKTMVANSLFNKIKKNFDFYQQVQQDLLPLRIYDNLKNDH